MSAAKKQRTAVGAGLRIFTGGLFTETCTFSPIPSCQSDWDQNTVRGGVTDGAVSLSESPLQAFRRKARALPGSTLIEGLFSWAVPSGPVVRSVYEGLRDELLADVKAALPLDVVLLNLHGSMVADGYDDCEGDICRRVRESVGLDVTIGAEFDLHMHPTPALMASTDAIVIYKEYPHVDAADRAEELFDMCTKAARGEVKLEMVLFNTRILGLFPTPNGRMQQYNETLIAAEDHAAGGAVLSVSPAHDHQWTDTPGMGAAIVVVTDKVRTDALGDPSHGAALAEKLGRELYAIRNEVAQKFVELADGLDQAIAAPEAMWPIILVDVPDNPGAGAPGDATQVLEALLHRNSASSGPLQAAVMLWDPVVTALCAGAGVGAELNVRIGGKSGVVSGRPVDLRVQVTAVTPGLTQTFLGGPIAMGDSVCVRIIGTEIDLVAVTERSFTISPECFEKNGIDVKAKHILVGKTLNGCHPGFDVLQPDRRRFIRVDYVGGCCTCNVKDVPFKHMAADRPMWPIDDESLPPK